MIQKDVKVRRAIQNTLEMDAEIFEALTSYEVGFHLIPLPKSSVEKAEKVERTNHYQPYNSGKGKSSGKGKKGKDEGQKGKLNILPKPLQGRSRQREH